MRSRRVVVGAVVVAVAVGGIVLLMAREGLHGAEWATAVADAVTVVLAPIVLVAGLGIAVWRPGSRDPEKRAVRRALVQGRAPDDPALDGPALEYADAEEKRTRVRPWLLVGFALLTVAGLVHVVVGGAGEWVGTGAWIFLGLLHVAGAHEQRRRAERLRAAVAARARPDAEGV